MAAHKLSSAKLCILLVGARITDIAPRIDSHNTCTLAGTLDHTPQRASCCCPSIGAHGSITFLPQLMPQPNSYGSWHSGHRSCWPSRMSVPQWPAASAAGDTASHVCVARADRRPPLRLGPQLAHWLACLDQNSPPLGLPSSRGASDGNVRHVRHHRVLRRAVLTRL